MKQKIENILTSAQCQPIALSESDVLDWLQRWREVYAAKLHAETGEWVHNDYDWHVFSFQKYAHELGDAAWAAYRRITPGPFLVLSADALDTFGFTCEGAPPDQLDCGVDTLIAPASMEWTMSFNHEGWGPFFAMSTG